MNSESSPSVLSGVSTSLPISLRSNFTSPQIPSSGKERHPKQPLFIRPQGYVYSLSGQAVAQGSLGQVSPMSQKRLPYGTSVVRRSRKIEQVRSLPYQKSHQSRFLCLEQDTEVLMQILQSQIHQESVEG